MAKESKRREQLLERRKELEELSRRSAESRETVELDQQRIGRLSRMDAMQEREMALATQRSRENEIRRIDSALQRLEAGDYGYCLSCDEEIGEKRLDHDPAATLCVDCAADKTG